MSEIYINLVVAHNQMTSELVRAILESPWSDTSEEQIYEILEGRNGRALERGEPLTPIPDTLLEQYIQYNSHIKDGTLLFSGETRADDHTQNQICQLLQEKGITYKYTMYHDEDNADTTIWSPSEGAFTYDICKNDNPTIPFNLIEEALRSGTDSEKLAKVEDLFHKRSPYGRVTPQTIASQGVSQLSQINDILAALDAGAISQIDAFEQIKLVKEA